MIETIERIRRAIELEPDPVKRSMMAGVLRQTLSEMEHVIQNHYMKRAG